VFCAAQQVTKFTTEVNFPGSKKTQCACCVLPLENVFGTAVQPVILANLRDITERVVYYYMNILLCMLSYVLPIDSDTCITSRYTIRYKSLTWTEMLSVRTEFR